MEYNDDEGFELQYADELEMIDDEDLVPVNHQQIVNTPASSLNITPFHPTSGNIDSPLLSQICQELHDTSGRAAARRYASTPFPGPSGSNSLKGSKKRRLEEIFGNIDDILEEPFVHVEQAQKKVKSEEERDLELIEAIVSARKKYDTQALLPKTNNLDKLELMRAFKMQNLSYTVPKWPFVKMVHSDTDKIYVRCHSEEFETNQINEIDNQRSVSTDTCLFGDKRAQLWSEANAINNKRLDSVETVTTEQVEIVPDENSLWVEKYKPRRYVDLLSDESCNRHLLKWLKLWDKVVFGKDVRKLDNNNSDMQKRLNTFNKKTGKFEQNGGWIKKNRFNLNTELDESDRPLQKIALLAGSPGLGKTTLALTIARHAGYEVVEINASDDRTPEAFKQALENGTQMQSVFSGHQRPNCIILDEIDGAPAASIDFLLKFVAGTASKKNKKTGELKRPIICICNELYVASLRQLRQQAFVINVPNLNSARLVDRLQEIAYKEKIKVDMTTLFALAEKTGNDIRSCLSLLQFFSSKKKELTLTDIIRSNIGQKDQHKELFKIWGSIFQVQRPSKALLVEQEQWMIPQTTLSPESRMQYVLQVVSMSGDYEKLMQGIFENYLHQKMPDPNFNGISEAADWFTFNDRLQAMLNHSQNYSIYSYLSYAFVSWHFLFATLAWPKINFPNKSYEVLQKSLTIKNILNTLRKSIEPSKRGIGDSPITMFVDSLPLINRILCPQLRSVSLHLLTSKEKSDVKDTVNIMSDLGLSYLQLKASDGTYTYQLEPDLETLTGFYESSSTLSYWAKQLISREVETEKMRRIQIKSNGKLEREKSKKINNEKSKTKCVSNDEHIPNFLRTLQPVALKSKPSTEITRKDFFGRITTKTVSTNNCDADKKFENIVKGKIWYCYKEGFNNAVRKNVTISDLL